MLLWQMADKFFELKHEHGKMVTKILNINNKLINVFEKAGIPKDVTIDLLKNRVVRSVLDETFQKYNVRKSEQFRLHARTKWFKCNGLKLCVKILKLEKMMGDVLAKM